jgi:uncharacterized protein (DUF2147 family)
VPSALADPMRPLPWLWVVPSVASSRGHWAASALAAMARAWAMRATAAARSWLAASAVSSRVSSAGLPKLCHQFSGSGTAVASACGQAAGCGTSGRR